jgi:phosphatidylinositol glycan class M
MEVIDWPNRTEESGRLRQSVAPELNLTPCSPTDFHPLSSSTVLDVDSHFRMLCLKFESMAVFFTSPSLVFLAAILLRVVLFFYGLWQDANSPMKYTDIDYFVFTDASRFIAHGQSPYNRETYRYTPLLALMLLPTTWSSTWFSFGKAIFAVGDIVAGLLIVLILRSSVNMPMEKALKFASIWLLNPMVATISTRGSSEGLLGVMVIALLWAVMQGRVILAGVLLGFGVHFKIYPFIYAPSIIWWLDDECLGIPSTSSTSIVGRVKCFCNTSRINVTLASLATFIGLNAIMYSMYVTHMGHNHRQFKANRGKIWLAISAAHLSSSRHAH